MKFFKGIALATVLTASIVITQPLYTVNTFAAAIEDCDLNGYDDHTGNPVPWIGFDSTKGESIPAGWDGHTTYKSKGAFEAANSSGSGSSSGSSGSSSSNGSSSNGSSAGSSSKTSTSKTSTSKSSTPKSSTSKSSTSKTSTSKSSTSKSSTSKSSTSSKTSKDVNSNQKSDEQVTEANEEVTTSADENNTDKKKSKKKKSSKKKKNKKSEIDAESVESETEEETQAIEIEEILSSKGTLEISEANGSKIHAGSDLIIKGIGFAGNVDDYEVEIHSNHVVKLGSVNTLEDGSFEANVYIPGDLEEGEHEVVIKYQGQQVAVQTIQVGEKVADTFLSALTVGFSSQNAGFIPGLLILAGLLVAGIATLAFGSLFKKKEKK